MNVVVGIDVGGQKKGFHCVAISNSEILATEKFDHNKTIEVCQWCEEKSAIGVAIDAPCQWSNKAKSRQAERELRIKGEIIQCYKTPTLEKAKEHPFYGWVVNGQKLYKEFESNGRYRLWNGGAFEENFLIETFPHAVACYLTGCLIFAGNKTNKKKTRLEILTQQLHDVKKPMNIDFIDAALCALSADAFLKKKFEYFGDKQEGYIVVPKGKA